MNSFGKLSPSLAIDSPSLFGLLKKALTPSEVELLSLAYEVSVSHGLKDRANLRRTPESSFNPKPARVAQILLTEGGITKPAPLAAAMLLAAPHSLNAIPEALGLARFLADDARQLLERPQANSEFNDSAQVALALLIDDLRHLHMQDASQSDREMQLNSSQHFLDSFSNQNTARLLVLARASLERGQRTLEKV